MTTQGLTGFRYKGKDKLAYSHADADPDSLGQKVLQELRDIKDWDKARDRVDSLIPVPEQRMLDEHSSVAETELRRAFSDLKYDSKPRNYYDLYRPLQGTLKPYLDGKLMFMPEASDFIYSHDW